MTLLSATDQASMEATVVESLDRVGTITRAIKVNDGMGAHTEAWGIVAADVACRLRPTKRSFLRLDPQREGQLALTVLTVPKTTDLRLGDRVHVGNVTWAVTGQPLVTDLTLTADVALFDADDANWQADGIWTPTDLRFERGIAAVQDSGVPLFSTDIWVAPYPASVLKVRARQEGGSATVMARRKPTDLMASPLSLPVSGTWYTTTTFVVGSTGFNADDVLEVELLTVDGTVTEVEVQVEFRREPV